MNFENLYDDLKAKTERLELAWEAARGGVFEHRIPIDETTYISDQWAGVLGYTRSTLPHYSDLLDWVAAQAHPDHLARFKRHYDDLIEGRTDQNSIEMRFRHRDGHWIWVRKIARVLERGPDGRARKMLRMMIDINDLKTAIASRYESESRFRTLADNISQLAWMAKGDGWIFWYNQRWYDYTGTDFANMKGWGWDKVHHPDHIDKVTEKFKQHLASGMEWEDTFPLRGADGEYRWFLSRAIPIRNDEGKVVRWFGTNTDVTDLRNIEAKLKAADSQKDEFISMLGHELRNPLAAIRSASDLLRLSYSGDEHIAKTQSILERQTRHMAKLVDGLLDMSRLIYGKIQLEPEVLDLSVLCREVMNDVAAHSGADRIQLHMDLPAEPVWINADMTRITQVVSNLLFNAEKYTPDGGEVQLCLKQDSGKAVLTVRDTGIGIAEDFLPHVFDTFRQHEQSIDRSEGGLGLGLAMVKMVTELHKGTVIANSDGPDQGAVFTVSLPLAEKARQPDPTRIPNPVQPVFNILLIEDNRDAAALLKELLSALGHQVRFAHCGLDGIALAQLAVPDIVISDLGLPDEMNGYDVASAMRSDPIFNQTTLIALTGYGRPEDQQACLAAGFDFHLTKPLNMQRLTEILASLPKASGSG